MDHKALAEYICKYATKPEKETATFAKVLAKAQAEKDNSNGTIVGVVLLPPTLPPQSDGT